MRRDLARLRSPPGLVGDGRERLREPAEQIGGASYPRLDVTDVADVQSFVDWMVAEHGWADVIVNRDCPGKRRGEEPAREVV